MEKCEDRIAAFDSLYTTNNIKILKTILPYFPKRNLNTLAVVIKFMELYFTITTVNDYSIFNNEPESNNPTQIIDDILPFCNPELQNRMTNLKETFINFENMKEMFQMIQMLKQTNNSDNNDSNNSNEGFADILSMFGDFDFLNIFS